MKEKYLPLGSVVILKEAKKKLMITGYRMKAIETPDKIYDYCGCIHPEGTISSELTCVFDHSQIEKVFFTGYVDKEVNNFLEKISDKQSMKKTTAKAERKEQEESNDTEAENIEKLDYSLE